MSKINPSLSNRILRRLRKRFFSRRPQTSCQQTSRRRLQAELLENRRLLAGDYEFGGTLLSDVAPTSEASLAETISATFGVAGDFAITDNSSSNNRITVKLFSDGVNDFVDITDANAGFMDVPSTSPVSILSSDRQTLRIPFSAITGSFTINTAGGDDIVTLDYSSGNFDPTGRIAFNAGEGGDDALRIVGYDLSAADGVTDVSVVHHSFDSGTVTLVGLGTIDFDEIEPLSLSGNAADMTITLPVGADSVTLGDDGGPQDNNGNTANTSALFDSTPASSAPFYSFEFTEFTNPTNSLTLLRGSSSNHLTVRNIVSSGFNASLNVGTSDARFDDVHVLGAVTLASNKTASVFADSIQVAAPITTAGGAITMDASNGISITKPIVSNGGVQTLQADANGDGIGTLSLDFPIAELIDPNPAPSNFFGASVLVLSSGNVVVTSPFDDFGGVDAGAVYLFNGTTGALISTLRGSAANQNVGITGVTALTNGNFVVRSANWGDGLATNVGAVTWGNGVTGINGVVSSANSLVGSTTGDAVGGTGVTALANGNYVVRSSNWTNGAATNAGAVTWGNGTTGISGVVNAANSLVGTSVSDNVGSAGITALNNSNFILRSPNWDNGSVTNAGAVTWGSGTTGVVGAVSPLNSLVGSSDSDSLGTTVVIAINNGNYVVRTPTWDNGSVSNVGAITWGNGTTGISGVISVANSLIGSSTGDSVGSGALNALSSGNYVAASPSWDNTGIADAGAVTWGNGLTGTTGFVSTANSLVGTKALDNVGMGITSLNNGNYVVRSPNWDNGTATNAGAVTWVNGSLPLVGQVSTTNSLVGSLANNSIGSGGVTSLTNGNFVVRSNLWDDGLITDVGAVTWGNGTTGIVGVVSIANSLVGSRASDTIGNFTITALNNGNYVVASPNWDSITAIDAGAVTWGNGTTGVVGVVSASNSLVGSTFSDRVGGTGITALGNGNYVVRSSQWDNGTVADAGAVTWGNGTTGIVGTVNATNSLVGSTDSDSIGGTSVTALTGGNYAVVSHLWDNGPTVNAGAVTWANGSTGISGPVSTLNSVFGNSPNSSVAPPATTLGGQLSANANVDTLVATFPNDGSGRVVIGSSTHGFRTKGSVNAGSGSVSMIAGDVQLQTEVISTRTVSIMTQQVDRQINLGTETAGSLSLTDEELDRVTAATLAIGRNNIRTGAVTVSSPIDPLNASALSVFSSHGIVVNANITGGTRGLTLSANQQSPSTVAQFFGVQVTEAVVSALDNGPVQILGTGGAGTGSGVVGVLVNGPNAIITSSGGSVTVVGNGGGGAGSDSNSHGVQVFQGEIAAGGNGNLFVTGTGGSGSGSNNSGVVVNESGAITSAGSGSIVVTGTGGTNAGNNNRGVYALTSGRISAEGSGLVTVIGDGGSGPGMNNIGVLVAQNASVASAGGAVFVTGTGGGSVGAGSGSHGILIASGGQITSAENVPITINATAGSGLTSNVGLIVNGANSMILSGGAMNIVGTGSFNTDAVRLTTSGSLATRNNSPITITADSLVVTGTPRGSINSGTGVTTIRTRTIGTRIDLGGADVFGGSVLTLGLADIELDQITAGTINIGDSNSGVITLRDVITRPSSTNVNLTSGQSIDFLSGSIDLAGGALNLNSGNDAGEGIDPAASGTDVAASMLAFGAGDDLRIMIDGTSPDSQYRQLNVTGAINLTGVDLVLSGGYVPTGEESFTIVSNDGTDAIIGTFAGLPEGAIINNFLGSGLPASITYQGGSNNNDVVITTQKAPTVTDVIVSGSEWTPAFIDAVDGGGIGSGNGLGYSLTPGVTLPNIGIDRIYIQFSEPVVGFSAATVAMLGSNLDYRAGTITVTYDAFNMRGEIQLLVGIVNDKLRLGVSDGVTDLASIALDGDSNNSPGGHFDFRFNVLVGDASGDGSVNGGDIPAFASSFNRTAGHVDFNPRADWNANGSVNGGDLSLFALNFNRSLPVAEPGPLSFPPPSIAPTEESLLAPTLEDIEAFFSLLEDEDELLMLEEG